MSNLPESVTTTPVGSRAKIILVPHLPPATCPAISLFIPLAFSSSCAFVLTLAQHFPPFRSCTSVHLKVPYPVNINICYLITMQYTLALLALTASACAQGVTQIITPPAPAPTGCSPSFTGNFMINVQNVTTTPKKRGLEKVRVTVSSFLRSQS